jgi:hypothetical protein
MMAVLIDENEICELHASNKWATGCCKNRKARIQLYTWQLYAATAEHWFSHTQRLKTSEVWGATAKTQPQQVF